MRTIKIMILLSMAYCQQLWSSPSQSLKLFNIQSTPLKKPLEKAPLSMQYNHWLTSVRKKCGLCCYQSTANSNQTHTSSAAVKSAKKLAAKAAIYDNPLEQSISLQSIQKPLPSPTSKQNSSIYIAYIVDQNVISTQNHQEAVPHIAPHPYPDKTFGINGASRRQLF